MSLYRERIKKRVTVDTEGNLVCGLCDTSDFDDIDEYEVAFLDEMDLDTGINYVVEAYHCGETDRAYGTLLMIDEDEKPWLIQFLSTLVLICEITSSSGKERAKKAIDRYAARWYSYEDEIAMLHYYYYMQINKTKKAEQVLLDALDKRFQYGCAYKLLEIYFLYGQYKKAIRISWMISKHYAENRVGILDTEYETVRVLSYCYLALDKYTRDCDEEALRSCKEMLSRYLQQENFDIGYSDRIKYLKRQFDLCPV